MDPGRAAPPAAERCLVLRYASSGQKGGTLIDESVGDLADHEARMHDPGSYRPKEGRGGGGGRGAPRGGGGGGGGGRGEARPGVVPAEGVRVRGADAARPWAAGAEDGRFRHG